MGKYLLGVDGGNSKTDYLLCTMDGDFVDVFRSDTCSHEHFDTSYDGMEQVMRNQLNQLLTRNNINIEDIEAAGFGLAGADLPGQIEELTKRVKKIGFGRFAVANDGVLGIKGACESGAGVCAVNGAGTVVLGMDELRNVQQVGGIGPMSGDNAGGYFIAREIITAWYAYYYRCGEHSVMCEKLNELFGEKSSDIAEIINDYELVTSKQQAIIKIGDEAAEENDKIAKAIFDGVGQTIGNGVAGCIKLLSFADRGTEENPLDIVMVGSIWHKVNYKGMRDTFEKTVLEKSGKICRYTSLKAPPAVGGVLWAKEIMNGSVTPAFRKNLLDFMTLEKYESLVYGK